jgi:hypothetical protein
MLGGLLDVDLLKLIQAMEAPGEQPVLLDRHSMKVVDFRFMVWPSTNSIDNDGVPNR